MTLLDTHPLPARDRPTRRPSEPPIEVRAVGGRIVIRPRVALDHDGLDALTDAVRAAITAGATTVVDLERHPDATPADGELAHCDGVVALPTVVGTWLLDVRTRRVCRSAPGGMRFLPPAAWTLVRSVTITNRSISVATATGEHIAAARRPDELPRLVA